MNKTKQSTPPGQDGVALFTFNSLTCSFGLLIMRGISLTALVCSPSACYTRNDRILNSLSESYIRLVPEAWLVSPIVDFSCQMFQRAVV